MGIRFSSIFPPYKRGRTKNKKPPADSGFYLSLLPFQTPTRLAVGLGFESTLFPVLPGKYAPNIGSPVSILRMDLGCYSISTLVPAKQIVKGYREVHR